MDNTKFSYYDIVGLIVPGTVAFLIFYWFIAGFLAFTFTVGKDIPESVALLIVLVGGYFFGHVVHAIGRKALGDDKDPLSWFWKKVWNECSPEYQYHLKTGLVRTFAPDFTKQSNSSPSEVFTSMKPIEQFHLAHALIRKEKMADNTDTLEAICNMYRGLYACALVSAITCLVISLKQLLLVLVQILMPGIVLNGPFLTLKLSQLTLAIPLTILFTISAFMLFRPGWEGYKEYYVKSVLTNLHVWCQQSPNEQPPNKPASDERTSQGH